MRFIASIVLTLLMPAAGLAGAELVLEDGQVLQGTELERKDDVYILSLSTGGVITIPAGLVKEFHLIAEGEPEEKKEAPSGLRETGPEELSESGIQPRLPRLGDQIEAFDKPPARFRNDIVDPNWIPTSDWADDPELNNFNPARWYKAPINPTWNPVSAYDAKVDVFRGNRSTWRKSLIDTSWTPTDGFERNREDIVLIPQDEYLPRINFQPEP